MPEPEYVPIPAHIHAIACALVTTHRDDESPVVIRVEDIPSNLMVDDAVSTVYPVTFVARYATHDVPDRLTGERRAVCVFAGWDCQHTVADNAHDVAQGKDDDTWRFMVNG